MEKKTFTFYINTRGDRSVGIWPVDDEITVTVDSGDPGGDEGEFEEFIMEALREWYDDPQGVSKTKPEEWDHPVEYEERSE